MDQFFTQLFSILPEGWMRQVAWFAILLAITFVCERAIAHGLRRILRSDENPLPATSIIVNIARGTVWFVGGSIILETCFDVNVSTFVAALGVGGIAISLGFQDTLSNLIGGLQLTFMRVVAPGDHIRVGTDQGVVTDVGLRHTTIENATGEIIIIPNSVLSKSSFVKLPPASLVVVPFAITSTAEPLAEDADRIARATEEAVRAVSPIVSDPPVKVLFSDITEYGFRGKVILRIEDPGLVAAAIDAAVCAIAPFTR